MPNETRRPYTSPFTEAELQTMEMRCQVQWASLSRGTWSELLKEIRRLQQELGDANLSTHRSQVRNSEMWSENRRLKDRIIELETTSPSELLRRAQSHAQVYKDEMKHYYQQQEELKQEVERLTSLVEEYKGYYYTNRDWARSLQARLDELKRNSGLDGAVREIRKAAEKVTEVASRL